MEDVEIKQGRAVIHGTLVVPENAKGIVIFAHGSGSGRMSPRNRLVAEVLNKNHIATLLIDLLTESEESIDALTRIFRFDISLLAKRLLAATLFVKETKETQPLPIGYFGASTGAAAALVASAMLPDEIQAVISRGGRPDLANGVLQKVKAATELIVGGRDIDVIDLNKEALHDLTHAKEKNLHIVPGASHLFEEPGTLEEVATLTTAWFEKYL